MPNKIIAQYEETLSDLGEEYPRMACGCDDCKKDSEEEKKKKKHYPRTTFSTEQMPSLAGADVGDRVSIVVEGEVVAKSKGDMWGEEDEEKQKTRITVKMVRGVAEKQEKEDNSDVEAMQKSKKKETLDLENLGEEKKEDY